MNQNVTFFIIVFSSLLFIYIYFYNKKTSDSIVSKKDEENKLYKKEKTLHIAHVHIKNDLNGFKFINKEKFPFDCIIHNYQMANYDELPKFLETIYSWKIRHFVGFNDSEMIKVSLDFFKNHPDVILISSGNNFQFPNLPNNIWNLALPISSYIHSIKKYYHNKGDSYSAKFTNWIFLYQKDNFWAKSFLKEINNISKISSKEFDPYDPDWTDLDKFINLNISNNLLILEKHKEYLSTIIDRYNHLNIHFIDESKEKLTYQKRGRSVFCIKQQIDKNDDPFILNLHDSIIILYKSFENNVKVSDVELNGLSGKIQFDKETHFRKNPKVKIYEINT